MQIQLFHIVKQSFEFSVLFLILRNVIKVRGKKEKTAWKLFSGKWSWENGCTHVLISFPQAQNFSPVVSHFRFIFYDSPPHLKFKDFQMCCLLRSCVLAPSALCFGCWCWGMFAPLQFSSSLSSAFDVKPFRREKYEGGLLLLPF